MSFERTMYKLLIAALALAIEMYGQIAGIFALLRTGTPIFAYGLSGIIYLIARFLIALMALYWVPKVVKTFFPEVS